MSAQMNILGLGLKLLPWRSLVAQLSKRLKAQGFDFHFQLVARGWKSFANEALTACDRLNPGLLLIDPMALGGAAELLRLIRLIQEQHSANLPRVLLVVPQARVFFAQWLKLDPRCRLLVAGQGFLSLEKAEQILEPSDRQAWLRIEPTPRVHIKRGGNGWDPIAAARCIPLKAIDRIIWKGEEYQPQEFFDLQCYLNQEVSPLRGCKGLLREGQGFALKLKLDPTEILRIEAQGVFLEQVIPYACLKKKAGGERILEEIKSCFLQKWVDLERVSLSYLKAFIPFSLVSSHSLAAKMIRVHLLSQGVKKVEDRPKTPYSLHLFFSSYAAAGECLYFLDLSGDELAQQIQALPDLAGDWLAYPLPPKQSLSDVEIQEERERVKTQVRLLFERQKQLSSKKAIASQEIDLIHQGHAQVRLFLELAGRIQLLEENQPQADQDNLIFYDDPALAGQLSRGLLGRGRNLFIDLAELEGLDNFLRFHAPPLEAFRGEGAVYASEISRSRLIQLMQSMLEELPQEGSPDSLKEEKALELEGAMLDQALDELSFLALWNLTQELVQVNLGRILEAAAQAMPEIEQELFKLNRPHRVALFSLHAEERYRLESFCSALFGEQPKEMKFVQVPLRLSPLSADSALFAPLKLNRQEQKQQAARQKRELEVENVNQLKDFLAQASYDLLAAQADFLCLEGELALLLPLVEVLRKTRQQGDTPILGLVYGGIDPAGAQAATDLGMKLVYQGSTRKDPCFLAQMASSRLSSRTSYA